MILVIVIFVLLNGGEVRVEREHHDAGLLLNEEECEIMAYDVMNELAGAKPPRIDMNKVDHIKYDCRWII